MNYFFITGTSKGIGKALCTKILEGTTNRITGISRSQGIIHHHYKHLQADLALIGSISAVAADFFEAGENPEKLVLINNAATLGDVGHFGSITDESLIELYNLNVIAPGLLMNRFIKKFKETAAEKIIINISSGAGSRPVDGWGGYCSSKAAVNMMSEVAALENNLDGHGFHIFSLAPGVVDTEMQGQIRKVDKSRFSDVDRFIKLKENRALTDPETTAVKILKLVSDPQSFSCVIQDVRDF